jgi:hypothetical protein
MIRARIAVVVGMLGGLLLAACAPAPVESVPVTERAAIAGRLMRDIERLASDEFGGRQPGTPGEELTLSYIEARMTETGLVSGTGDPGSYWRMPVDLVATRPQSGRVRLSVGRRALAVSEAEAAAFTPRRRALAAGGPATGVPVIFAGNWDAPLAPETVAGAVVVLLDKPGAGRERIAAMASQRAIAVLTIVADADRIARVRGAESAQRTMLASEEIDTLSAYVTDAALAEVLGSARWARLKADAASPDFSPIEINLAITIEATSDRREFASHNLVGMIPGTRPASGAVLVLAHWDHLGECAPASALDRICNGAADNASGIAAMLELAQRLGSGSHPASERDIYFLATTAEEAGLLGARAFVRAPPLPLSSIVAAFNLDMVAVAPVGSPVGFVGQGLTGLDAVVLNHVARSGRSLGDRALADSFLQRQDGWVLHQNGVPAVLVSSTYGTPEVLRGFLASHYHRASDEAARIELGGAIEDVLLHEGLIRELADSARYPPPPGDRP